MKWKDYNETTFKKHCHNIYKLNWMLDNRCSIRELFENLDAIHARNEEYGEKNNYPSDNLKYFEENMGFGMGENYQNLEDFLDTTYKNKAYMKNILKEDEYEAYLHFEEERNHAAKMRIIMQKYGVEREYKKAKNELKNFTDLSAEASNGWTEEMIYCYEEFVDGQSLEIYGRIAEICKSHGIKTVYDIGCCYARQAYIFKEADIKYIGIEQCEYMKAKSPKDEKIHYITGRLPFETKLNIKDKEHTAAISNLCAGFLTEPNDKAWSDIARDFKYFCGIPGPSGKETMEKKFTIEKTKYYNILWMTSNEVTE